MGFSMNRPNMSISYGGESNKQQKSNLMKDNPVAKHASAMHMAGKKAVAYQQDQETPLEVTEEGAEKIAASDANPAFKKAIAKAKKSSPASMVKKPLSKEQQAYLDRTNKAMKKRAAAGKGHTHTSPKGGVPNPPVKKYKK